MKEEVIIDLKVQEDDGSFAKLSQLKSAMIGIKQEQKSLEQAYKTEKITLKEYTNEVVRLDANLKKISNDYSKLQRQVTGVESPFEKLGTQIKESAQQINVAGLNLATFANPVTATVGVLGLLTKAYASSTSGAKDLEFVTNQLGFQFTILSNNLNKLLGISGEDGEGPVTKLWNAIMRGWSPGGVSPIGVLSKQLAMAVEELEDLGREEMDILNNRNRVLEDQAETMAKLQDSQVSYGEKVHLTNELIGKLRDVEKDLVGVKEKQLERLELMLKFDKDNEDLQTKIKAETIEISNVKRDIEKRVQSIIKLESNLLDTEKKKTEQAQKQAQLAAEKEALARMKTFGKITKEFGKATEADTKQNVEALGEDWAEHNKKLRQGDLNEMKDYYKQRKKEGEKAADDEKERQQRIADYTVSLYANQINVYQQMLNQSNDIGTALLKGFLINMLRMLKAALQARIIGESFATLDSILSLGVSGAIRAAVLVGLLEGAFSVAENFISGFAEGGVVSGSRIKRSQGRPISRSNGDNVVITAKENEVILNEQQQALLGGPSTFKAIGVPGFDDLAGYATGGRIERALVRETSNSTWMKNLIDRLSEQQTVLVIEQVEHKLQQRALIREQAEL